MMKELKFDDLQKINGGLGGGPSSRHPKPNRKVGKCLAGIASGAMAGKGSWQTMLWGGISGSLNCF